MARIKTLSDVYVRPESLLRGRTAYLKLHILTNQLDRLKYNRNSILERLEQVDRKLEHLNYHYSMLKKSIGIIYNKMDCS